MMLEPRAVSRMLPARFGSSDAEGGKAAPPQDEQVGTNTPPLGRRVLIVDDSYLVSVEFEGALLDAGYDVVGTAVSADEAVAHCKSLDPDFVLMDIRLLGPRDGVSAALEIDASCGIKVVFVTANDDPETRARARSAQPIGWISKPLSGLRLVARLAELAAQSS